MDYDEQFPALRRYLDYFRRPAIEIHHDRTPRPKLFGTTKVPLQFGIWHGHGANPEWTKRDVPVGTTVQVVMASRFGDVGITDDLKTEYGYHLRVMPDSGEVGDWRDKP